MTRPLPNETDFAKPLSGVSRYSGRPVATRNGLPAWLPRSPAASSAPAEGQHAQSDEAGPRMGITR